MILTLEDKGILDEDDDDVLVNVNIKDDERVRVGVTFYLAILPEIKNHF